MEKRSHEEIRKLYTEISKRVASGEQLSSACADLKVNRANYYSWKHVNKNNVTVVEHSGKQPKATKPVKVPPAQLSMVVGSPEQIAAFYRELQ